MKKIVLAALIIFIVVGFSILKLFIIGAPANDNTLAFMVEEGDSQLAIYIESTDSAKAISNIEYRYNGTVMHLTVRTVLSSPLNNDGERCLYYEITDETEIWLGNKLIWSAN